ncbi:MAG: extracellular solute-binding protein [Acholeplasmataceae bacterium]|jgi:ABC-type glycerol-3-phosphate transport system substrate-binding protein|nr:extracellular solute-binding protein [Acholeplasmataceae bacterium]
MKKLIIVLTIVFSFFVTQVFEIRPLLASNEEEVLDLGQFRKDGYYYQLKNWLNSEQIYLGDEIEFFLKDYSHLELSNNYAIVEKGKTISLDLNIEEAALYHLKLEYLIEDEFFTQPTINLKINGETPFNEAAEIYLPIRFEVEQRALEDKYNRFGDELLPKTKADTSFYQESLIDNSGMYVEPLMFYFKKGVQTLSFTANNHPFKLKTLILHGKKETPSYQTYKNNFQNEIKSNKPIIVEGEKIDYKNDIEVKPGYYKAAGMRPEKYKTNILNMLDGNSMTRPGTEATYTLLVEETGLYELSFKYLQNMKTDMSVAKTILIDGKIPFKELEIYLFPYQKRWKNHTLNSEGIPFEFYLEKGFHTLTIKSTAAHLTDVIYDLYEIKDRINSIGFQVAQLVGEKSHQLIDWDIVKYLPTIKQDLLEMSDDLLVLHNQIAIITNSKKSSMDISPLKIASKQLKRISKKPNQLPNKFEEFHLGSGSAYQLIGEVTNSLLRQPLSIDYFVLHNDNYKIPQANANFFKRIWFNLKSFFYSFFDQRHQLYNKEKGALNVWVGQSTLYLDIMQNMIDSEFTKNTGIKVRTSILPNTQKIILNHATGTNPDVVLSIDSWVPYAYALRGLLTDLTTYDDFYEIAEDYQPNIFTPMIFEDGVYGIPETQGLSLLFYRKDILGFLEIMPPDTWDDILKILPILQSYQMNFFHPLGGEDAYKGFGLTSPIIYQMGGEIYKDVSYQTTFDEEETIKALTFLTEIFTIHNLPQQVPSFFEHFRSGSLPIGIGSVDFYLQLKYAAPELNGQWGVLPIPGIYDQELAEVARWAPNYGKASIILKTSKMQTEAFQLVKWWNKPETQLEYLENIKMVLGERFMFLPANLKTLEYSAWDEALKKEALVQAQWSRIPAVTPGSYIIERELTNIWNKIVIDKINPRIAIDQSIPRINRELARKFEEFGYLKGGSVVREYVVPRNENIENWIKKKD